mmetsp:Transcript_3003/g.6955  ORF Transcript_3003/g.6955 Transcript_3003/m.6955 type:complete len:554 (-) Transcript_3003:339-2000(-)
MQLSVDLDAERIPTYHEENGLYSPTGGGSTTFGRADFVSCHGGQHVGTAGSQLASTSAQRSYASSRRPSFPEEEEWSFEEEGNPGRLQEQNINARTVPVPPLPPHKYLLATSAADHDDVLARQIYNHHCRQMYTNHHGSSSSLSETALLDCLPLHALEDCLREAVGAMNAMRKNGGKKMRSSSCAPAFVLRGVCNAGRRMLLENTPGAACSGPHNEGRKRNSNYDHEREQAGPPVVEPTSRGSSFKSRSCAPSSRRSASGVSTPTTTSMGQVPQTKRVNDMREAEGNLEVPFAFFLSLVEEVRQLGSHFSDPGIRTCGKWDERDQDGELDVHGSAVGSGSAAGDDRRTPGSPGPGELHQQLPSIMTRAASTVLLHDRFGSDRRRRDRDKLRGTTTTPSSLNGSVASTPGRRRTHDVMLATLPGAGTPGALSRPPGTSEGTFSGGFFRNSKGSGRLSLSPSKEKVKSRSGPASTATSTAACTPPTTLLQTESEAVMGGMKFFGRLVVSSKLPSRETLRQHFSGKMPRELSPSRGEVVESGEAGEVVEEEKQTGL